MPTAFITGAAKRIGKYIALSLATQGYDIILHYHKSQVDAEQTRQELKNLGVQVYLLQADLADKQELRKIINKLAELPPIDVLINNASSFIKRDFFDISMDDWEYSLNVNTRAPFFLIQAIGKQMQEHGGTIINISDLSGLQTWTDFSSHAISKAALIHLTKIAAEVLAPKVRVNCIVPGIILPPDNLPVDWQKRIAKIPLQRHGTPENLSAMILHLIKNDFITGAVIPLTGGE